MASTIKKFIAGISAVAVMATMSIPVMAEATPVFDEDYTLAEANKNSWTRDDSNGTITAAGLKFTNTATGGPRWSGVEFDEAITSSALVEYSVQVVESSNPNATVICVGSKGNKTNELPASIVRVVINTDAASGDVNGASFTMSASGRTTPWLNVKHIINAESKEVTTTITSDNDDVIYEGSSAYLSSSASFAAFGISLGKNSCTATFRNLKISTVEAPGIEFDDISRIEVGTTEKIATVTNATDIQAELTDAVSFSYTIEDTGEVYVTADKDAVSGTDTTLTIKATGDVEVSKSITLIAQTAQEIADSVAGNIKLSGEAITDNGDGTYTVLGGFNVPVSDGTALISWSSDNNGVSVGNDGSVSVSSSANGTIVLTATVEYNGATADRDFTLIIPANKIFYEVDFNDASLGNLASIDGPASGEYAGITANVVTRSGSGNCNYVSIANGLSDSNYLAIVTSNYNVSDSGIGNQRKTYLVLSKMAGISISNTLHINFDVYFTKTTSSLLFTDGTNSIYVDAGMTDGDDLPAEKWYNVNIDSTPSDGVCIITIKDADGNVLSRYNSDVVLKNLKQIDTDGKNDIYFYIDNLVVADAVIPSITQETDTVLVGTSEKVATIKNASDIDVTLSNPTEFSYTVENGELILESTGSQSASTTVTVSAENEGVVTSETFTVVSLETSEIVGAALAKNTVYYTSDKKGQYIAPVIKDGSIIYNNVVLPSTEKVTLYGNTYVADVTWKVTSGQAYLSDAGVISVSDKSAHDVTLQKTVKYSKNGKVVGTDSATYSLKVMFEPDDVLEEVTLALAAKGADDATKAELLKAAVYDYQVAFDAAYDANFSSVPKSASSDIELPTSGYFGSEFKWSSSAPTVISNSGKFTKPSSSKTVNMVASVISGSAVAEKTFNISVAGSNTGSGGGGGGGSTSSTGTKNSGSGGGTIYTANTGAVAANNTSAADKVAQLQEEALAANDLFKDVSQAAWARDEINGLAKAGVINGKTGELFAPNDTITRAEFAKILMGTLGLASDAYTTSSFKDVSPDDWCFKYVESAYNLGIINGVGAGTFAPNALITRQDMAVMVARAAQVAGKDISEVAEVKTFADAANISDYAKASVDTLVKGGIINGMSDTEFAPLANATRAQAAKILYKFL